MWSTLPCSVARSGGSSLVRVIAGGEELTAPVKKAASVRERARGGGEMEEELTADSVEATARPGRGWSSRILESSPAAEGWGRAPGRRYRAPAVERVGVEDAEGDGGSSELIGEARGGRWPR